MKNSHAKFFLRLGLPVALGAFLFLGGPVRSALAATLTCTVGPTATATISCNGADWSPSGTVEITAAITDTCDNLGGDKGDCTADPGGDFTGCTQPNLGTLESGTWYLYGTEDTCSTSTADTNNSHVVAAGATCGNGTVETGEQCDDGNTYNNDGCSSTCYIENGWACSDASPSVCVPGPTDTVAPVVLVGWLLSFGIFIAIGLWKW